MFNFSLQKVLDLRERNEKNKAIELVAAEEVAERARTTRDEIVRLQQFSKAEVNAANDATTRVGHLQQLGMVLNSLEERLEQADQAVIDAESGVYAARGALEVAARDRQMLDRLKEKHAQEFRAQEQHRDRKDMDEIALTRFARNADESSRSASTSNKTPAASNDSAEGARA